MIDLHEISPHNEMEIATRLKAAIEQAWPEVAEGKRDRIDILVGLRLPEDVDILAIVDLDRPRDLPPQRRRSGGFSNAAEVQQELIAIEVKQLDSSRFERIGNQWFPIYNGIAEDRSVTDQASQGGLSALKFARQMGRTPFVYSLAWLTSVDEYELRDILSTVLGRDADWCAFLDAAMQQNAILADPGTPDGALSLQVVRERLLDRRKESRRDHQRVERLSRDLATRAVVDALVPKAGSMQIRLYGRGGSGKTTSLALLALRLAERGDRVLILTFHKILRSDIAHLVASLGRTGDLPPQRILVETTMSVLSLLGALGVPVPQKDGRPDYSLLDGVLRDACGSLVGSPDDAHGDIADLRAANPDRFAWDHVFIDEAQDCSESERDFLRALYGHRRLVLADGVDQLVRRQVACDWNHGVNAAERFVKDLDSSLRMLKNITTFVNLVARELDFPAWHIAPQPDLPGGRIIIAVGDAVSPDLPRAIVSAAGQQQADAVDCLICVPARSGDIDPCSQILAAGQSANIPIWNGTIEENRGGTPSDRTALRLVRYDSCRGLEGWITVGVDLDVFWANRFKYPNLDPNDPHVAAEIVAARSLLIPLTRAVHTLVITLRDPESSVARDLGAAAEQMPSGVVEWVEARFDAQTLAQSSFVC